VRKIPQLLAGVRAFFMPAPSDQELIDATEDLMVNGQPLTEEQKRARDGLRKLFDTINNKPLEPTQYMMNEADYNDIVHWSQQPSVPEASKDK
jgi:hypothetical protein